MTFFLDEIKTVEDELKKQKTKANADTMAECTAYDTRVQNIWIDAKNPVINLVNKFEQECYDLRNNELYPLTAKLNSAKKGRTGAVSFFFFELYKSFYGGEDYS